MVVPKPDVKSWHFGQETDILGKSPGILGKILNSWGGNPKMQHQLSPKSKQEHSKTSQFMTSLSWERNSGGKCLNCGKNLQILGEKKLNSWGKKLNPASNISKIPQKKTPNPTKIRNPILHQNPTWTCPKTSSATANPSENQVLGKTPKFQENPWNLARNSQSFPFYDKSVVKPQIPPGSPKKLLKIPKSLLELLQYLSEFPQILQKLPNPP